MSIVALKGRVRGWLGALREIDAQITELHERQRLLHRPWEEEFTHWSFDGAHWRLHGTLLAPAGRHRRSVTRGGWCPGLAADIASPPRSVR